MRHRVGYNRLGRKASHRHAMMKNMATSLLRHERIRTTVPKAKEVRRLVEKLITRAKVDSVHNRRIVAQTIGDKAVLAKLFVEIGPKFDARPGGYTRILKIGQRRGDAAEMAILELVEEMDTPAKKTAKKAPKKEAPAKQETAKEQAPAKVEAPAEEISETAPEIEETEESSENGTEEQSIEADEAVAGEETKKDAE